MHSLNGTKTQRRPRRDSLIVARCTDEMKAMVEAEAARRDLAPPDIVRLAIRSLLGEQPAAGHLIRGQEEAA